MEKIGETLSQEITAEFNYEVGPSDVDPDSNGYPTGNLVNHFRNISRSSISTYWTKSMISTGGWSLYC